MQGEVVVLNCAIVTAIAAAISAICGAVAIAYTAYQSNLIKVQLEKQNILRRAEVFMRFQDDFHQIQREFSEKVNDDDWEPTEDEERVITRYWYMVCDQWKVCIHIEDTLSNLWNHSFARGAKSALNRPAFKSKLDELFEKTTFGGQKDGFLAAMKLLGYKEREAGTPES